MDSENEKKLYALGFTKNADNEAIVSFQRRRGRAMEMIHFIKKGRVILRDTISEVEEDHKISEIIREMEKEYFKD